MTRFTSDLSAYAVAKGVPGLFHATITWAYLALVAERVHATSAASWDAFADTNADLLRWKPSVLDEYYSPARLWSGAARAAFVMPDRSPSPTRRVGKNDTAAGEAEPGGSSGRCEAHRR